MRTDNREDREYHVVTKNGQIHTGYTLLLSPTDVRLADAGASISREDVVEIRIHRDALLVDALFAPTVVVYHGVDDLGAFVLLIPVALAVVAVSAPVVLPIQGFKRLLPDKVIRVAP